MIACDESGYEGEKLIGTTTPLFAHGSVLLDPTAAAVGTVNILITLAVVLMTERLGGLESLYWGGRQ